MFHHRSSIKQKKPKNQPGKAGEQRVPVTKVNAAASSKRDRLNTLKQLRQTKREELLQRRRLGVQDGGAGTPPKVVALVAFHEQADACALKRQLLEACGADGAALDGGGDAKAAMDAVPTGSPAALPHIPTTTAVLPSWAQPSGHGIGGKPRVLLVDPPRDVMAILDVLKCADLLVCVLGPHASLEEPAFDELGYKLLTAMKSQGLPVTIGAVHGSSSAMVSAKKAAEAKKFVARYFASELGSECRLFPAEKPEEVKALVRALGSATPKEITWRADRGYLLAQEAAYSAPEGILCVRGYVRGPGFRCKHLVHLTGYGDFTLARLSLLPDPCPSSAKHRGSAPSSGGEQVVDELRPGQEPDMQRLQPYDPTTAEQTWPTAEELDNATSATRPVQRTRRSGAIPAPDAANVPIGDSDDDMEAEMGAAAAAGGAGEDCDVDADGEDGQSEGSEDGGASMAPSGTADTDNWEVSSNMTGAGDVPNAEMKAVERRRRELIQRSQEEMEFPDEVDTPVDVPAKERFQKYRGLKSFRTSPWDPYEELPVEYSRIWEFEAFASTARAFRQEYIRECGDLPASDGQGRSITGQYCALYLKGVPPTAMELQSPNTPFVVSALLPYEQKVSVVHGTVTRLGGFADPIKSKDELWLHCGFRRFMARPIFSEIPKRASTCKKFKFLRFLHPEVMAGLSMYAPVMFPPSRLLMFVNTDAGPELVGSGSIAGADPKQLVIKRVCLTGYPVKCHKSKCVARYMFFNPPDIRWFKPVELATKKGLRGHIVESVGTHGYMKCRFNGHIKQDDTIMMQLYKRAYPKWYPPTWGGRAEDGPETAE